MRIAQIAPLHEAVPPPLYGGTERVVSFLTEELVAMGHAVTLFASGALPQARWLGTVPHGLPPRLLTPQPGARPEYLAFLGRIAPEKGPDCAIRIARACGIPLLMAAKVSDADRPYFEAVIRPMLAGGDVDLVGEITDREKPAFLSGALALLMPISWPEPFGLAMIEAMACGTPVVAFNRGSVPEIVEDGRTGFIVEDEAGAVAAISCLGALPRAAVRAAFEARFIARRMAEDYLAIYRSLSARKAAPHALLAEAAK